MVAFPHKKGKGGVAEGRKKKVRCAAAGKGGAIERT